MAGRMAFLKDNKDWEATAKVRRYRADWCFFSPITFCSSFFPDFIWLSAKRLCLEAFETNISVVQELMVN